MKHVIEFRDARVQSIAEALFTPEQLKYLMVSKTLPVAPSNQDQREVWGKAIREHEADLAAAKQLLALTDMAVALNGGSCERILKYADNAEDNPEVAE